MRNQRRIQGTASDPLMICCRKCDRVTRAQRIANCQDQSGGVGATVQPTGPLTGPFDCRVASNSADLRCPAHVRLAPNSGRIAAMP